ncbi:MAG: glycosyltransferase [Alphaproteobacteria bacterium]|nr:glycosyltransferase [Alphaproteobacteria bacterium]
MSQTQQKVPFISVIIPIYNAEKFLRQSLNCVVSQTLNNIEIICINDGSTDASAQIVAEYAAKDSRISFFSQKNAGYGAAVNHGLDMAIGKYVAIYEPDDWIEPDMYEVLYKAAEADNADLVKADYFKYWSNGNDKYETIAKKEDYNKVFTPSPEVYISNIWGSIWSAIYLNQMIRDNHIRLSETPGASFQDTGFIFKTNICAKRVILLDKAFLHYRQDNSASSINSKDKIFCVCDEYDEIDKFLQTHNLRQWQNLANRKRCEAYFWNLERMSPDNRKTFIKRVKPFLLKSKKMAADGAFSLSVKKIKKLTLLEKSEDRFLRYYRIRDFLHKLRSII